MVNQKIDENVILSASEESGEVASPRQMLHFVQHDNSATYINSSNL